MICAHVYAKIQRSVEASKQYITVVCSEGKSAKLMHLDFPEKFSCDLGITSTNVLINLLITQT